jgi:hypothetical protein
VSKNAALVRCCIKRIEENIMTATYTFDIFSSLDGFGSNTENWGG